MNTKGLKAFAFAALAAVITPLAAQAVGGEGDICSIQAMPTEWYGTTGNAVSPLWVNDTLYIRVRLLNENWQECIVKAESEWSKPQHEWVLERNGMALPADWKEVVYRPALRIAIGSKIVSATLGEGPNYEASGANPKIGIYTDLYFSYTVKEGELGLPVRLVNANGEIIDSEDAVGAEGFSLINVRTAGNPVGYWDLKNDLGVNLANFKFGRQLSAMSPNPMSVPGYPDYDERYAETWPQYSISMVWPGIYVQTIGFEAHDGSWRVSKEGPDTSAKRPAVEGVGPATVYLWSSDESVMVPQGDVTTVDGRQVLTLRLGTLETTAFGMKATDTAKVGDSAYICLCSQPTPAKNAQGDILSGSFVSNRVEVIAPPPPSIRLSWDKTGDAGVYPDIVAAYTNDLTEVSDQGYPIDVTLSEPFGQPVTLTLRAKIANDETGDWDYVYTNAIVGTAVTDAGDVPSSFMAPPAARTINFGAAEVAKRIWVYPVGSTAKSKSKGDTVEFKVEFADGTPAEVVEKFTNESSCQLRVVDPNPGVLSPTEFDAITVGDPITLTVADSYRDRTAPRSFKVQVLNGTAELYSSDIVFTPEGKTPTDSVEIEMDKTSVLSKLQRDEARTVQLTVKVTDPLGQFASSQPFMMTVPAKEKGKTVSAVLYDTTAEDSRHEGTEFEEGASPVVRFVLSEPLEVGNDLYAFLVPQNEASSNLVSSSTFKEGVLIAGGKTNSVLNLKVRLDLLDGCEMTDGTSGQLSYKIVLRTSADPTKGTVDDTFADSEGLQLTVANVNTAKDALYINGSPESTPDGAMFGTTVASASDQTFVAAYREVSVNDLTNGIVTIWCFTDGRESNTFKYSAVTSTTDTAECKHTFQYAGGSDQKVMYIPVDKDLMKTLMGDAPLTAASLKTLWPSLLKVCSPYTVTVHVGAAKHVVVDPDNLTIGEDDTSSKVRFALSEPYDEGSVFLRVKVTSLNETSTAPGCAKFVTDVVEIKSGETEPARSPNYQDGLKFVYADLDGTMVSESDGFWVEAKAYDSKAAAEAEDEDGELKQYEAGSGYLYVRNRPPIVSPAPVITNKTISLNQEFEIKDWWAKDVKTDLAAGLTCKWYIDESPVEGKVMTVTDSAPHSVSGLKFTSEGLHEVRLEVTDKDGADANGQTSRIWLYYVSPTKRVEVTPYGPGATASMVSKYGTADGLGKGRVWAGAASTIASEFTYSFNCSLTVNELTVYAFGYPAAEDENGYFDNGQLTDANGETGKDVAISPSGATAAEEPYFTYGVTQARLGDEWKYDNFFYCWVNSGEGDAKCVGEKFDGIPKPATKPNIATKVTANLDPYDSKKESYAKRELEVVFSREWLPSDNGGDINADGVPDVFMVKEWRGGKLLQLVYGDAEGNASDLRDLAQSNPDGDFLPGVWDQSGPNKSSYAPIGRTFTTLRELRGFATGLNAQDDIQSDPDFSDDEDKAWRKWLVENDESYDPENPPADDDPFWKPDLARWSPEPSGRYLRMDPTLSDTDGDGFDDGWEYYFWYQAHVNAPAGSDAAKPKKGQTSLFERFDAAKYIIGTVIPNEEVEAYFNPCTALSDAQRKASDNDFDFDGLSDYEEYLIGTNPCHWDTDGDHMCDAWEVMMSLNPLDEKDKSSNDDGDFMASLNTALMYGLPVEVEVEGAIMTNWYFDAEGTLRPGVHYDPLTHQVLKNVEVNMLVVRPLLNGDGEIELYGRIDDRSEDMFDPSNDWPCGLVRNPEPFNGESWWEKRMLHEGELLYFGGDTAPFVMIHDQVRSIFGFDPRTAWYKDKSGYVGTRWNNEIEGMSGVAVHTREYQAYDEYLVARYRSLYGIVYRGEKIPTKTWERIMEQTTVPNVIGAVTASSEAADGTNVVETTGSAISEAVAKAFAEAGSDKRVVETHGADTDGDGVPDGWELYVRRCPNVAAGKEEGPVEAHVLSGLSDDRDDDGLTFAMEFAGVDSCKAYESCPTIAANNPGTARGWYNKFFPTDPDNWDTDGDTIADSYEGSPWKIGEYVGDGKVLGAKELTFIYGDPQDDGSCCIRGGGSNPCSADTDCDGLPDPWERQYAGWAYDIASGSLDQVRLAAAGLASSTNKSGVILIDGMDATWGGDVYTDPFDMPQEKSASYDPVTKTVRDVDWDHDGLQNWQEYLVQTLRHLRYDDISTPLMGRVLEEGSPAAKRDHGQRFMDFVTMTQDADDFCRGAALAWYGEAGLVEVTKTNAMVVTTNEFTLVVTTNYDVTVTMEVSDGASVVKRHQTGVDPVTGEVLEFRYAVPWTAEGWKALGYMSTVAHQWDRANCRGCPQMLYPIGIGQYVSSDPRLADTDGDGMDDYYELFHGLNPILGGAAAQPGENDVIAEAWGSPMYFNAYWNEWSHPDYDRVKAVVELAVPSSKMSITEPMCLDPVLYPWAIGVGTADPDGDGIRNDEERILANQASPQTTHTDPTPLWMTDTSKPSSYVSQYYRTTGPIGAMPFWLGKFGIEGEPYFEAAILNGRADCLYSFEENEGYDTDNDWQPDGVEIVKTAKSATSPLNFSDPNRRQAMYFPGKDGYVMSKELQFRGASAVDMLKQFTVEAWVRPEQTGVEQTIIERSSYCGGDAVTKAGGVIRANFRIGLAADGRVYGMFDNSDSIESGLNQPISCQRVDGLVLPVGEWSHVALSYDGKALTLYANGELCKQVETSLIPATGVSNILQDPKDTARFPSYQYSFRPVALFVGARPKHMAEVGEREVPLFPYYVSASTGEHVESFANMKEYFKGYVDEVRIWDGARTGAEILENYRKRMSFADVAENRKTVYQSWLQGATRNDQDAYAKLPAELVHHYNFVTLPGAVNAEDVAKLPAGFDKAVQAQVDCDYKDAKYPDVNLTGLTQPKGLKNSDPESMTLKDGIEVGWWQGCGLRSTVYSDARVVPWIENTVSHLPMLDGSCVDSFLYAESLGGAYLQAPAHGVDKFVFPNDAVPYASYNYWVDRYVRLFTLNRLAKAYGEACEPLLNMYRYDVRSRFIGTTDLLPLGGAFAKTCPQMWDDGSAADAWEVTIADDNANGLADWWEEYARENYCTDLDPEIPLGWDTAVMYAGTEMAAYQAYLIDLARGMQPDGSIDPAYAATADSDGDNIPDWWENLWGVAKYGADDDPDNDGLSNFAEYMLSFGSNPYGIENGFPLLNPMESRSGKDQLVIDYFLPGPAEADEIPGNVTVDATGKTLRHFNSNEYLGEIATDHDFMENWWEKQYKNSFANAGVYDPQLDTDEDGWSNYAECRAALWCGNYVADLVDRYIDNAMHFACYPEPAIGVKPYYYGAKDVKGAPLVVRTWTGISPRVDATFIVPHEPNGSTKVIGGFRTETVMRGFMNPGSVLPSSVVFEKALSTSDRTYMWSWDWYLENYPGNEEYEWLAVRNNSGTFEEYKALFLRYPHIELKGGDLEWLTFATSVGDSMGKTAKIVHGKTATEIGMIDLKTGEWALDTDKLAACDADGNKLDSCLLRITYASQIGAEWPQAVWLSDTQEFGHGDVIGKGHVKQGMNTVEAFLDLSGDGIWQPGEPYGMVRNVEVGWHKVPELAIELKDEGVAMTRQELAGEGVAKFVIRRKSINGMTTVNGSIVPQRLLATRSVVMDDRPYLTEADILTGDNCDLDWKWLAGDVTDKLGLDLKDLRSVEYTVEYVANGADGEVFGEFVRNYNMQRAKPVVKSPTQDKPVYAARPTFSFASSDETMTAYQIQVFTSTNSADMVWDSGVQPLPARQGLGVGEFAYAVTPALYADCATTTNGSPVFMDGSNYYWRVALLNAKYSNTGDASCWSEFGKFQMDVGNVNRYPQFSTGYGCVAAAVRYYGPGKAVEGEIVVEAFENADFTGSPLARVRIGDVSAVDSIVDITTTNALLRGIEPGTVYLRAYIDQNNNGKRDSWESWGYLNSVGGSGTAIYNPVGVTVVDSLDHIPNCTIYIEDCDLNGDEIPDCLEPEKFTGGGDGGSSAGGQDGDKDGLTDEEESDIYGTDPTMWDTDGDGMPDGWEQKFAGLDPNFYDAEEVVNGDWMAYAEVDATLVTVQNTDDPDDVTVYVLGEGVARKPQRGDKAVGLPLYETYVYETSKDGVLQGQMGLGKSVKLAEEAGKLNRVVQVTDSKVVLVHAQVYDRFGFEPGVAVSSNAHTKAFTALDKYLVVRYLEAQGLANEETMNLDLTPGQQWKDLTLKPLLIDSDRDGIADGWELYVKHSPWDFESRSKDVDGDQLDELGEYDGGRDSTDPWSADTDRDGVSDYYAYLYHLKGGNAGKDNDGDGLSNYAEYIISEVLKYAQLDPDDAKTDGYCSDYFRKVGDVYLGEIFTDHDQVDDVWEGTYFKAANRYVYDPERDDDNDGWSNWAEAKAGTDPTAETDVGIEGYVLAAYPVPCVETYLACDTKKATACQVIVKAWSQKTDPEMTGEADVVWSLGEAAEGAGTGKQGEADSGNVSKKYIGLKPDGVRTFNLGPGAIQHGSVRIVYKDLSFCTAKLGPDNVPFDIKIGNPSAASWYYMAQDREGVIYTVGGIVADEQAIGTVDYETGKVTIDFNGKYMNGMMLGDPNSAADSEGGNSGASKDGSTYDLLNLDQSYVLMTWSSCTTVGSLNRTLYLADANCSASGTGYGHLREGLNTFMAFADVDGNGEYTPGEPFGVVRDVDVGWDGAKVKIQLTDASPIFARVNLYDGTSDRLVYWGAESGDVDGSMLTNFWPDAVWGNAENATEHVRVVPYAVAGMLTDTAYYDRDYVQLAMLTPNRVVAEFDVNANTKPCLTEADILGDGQLDIDWNGFVSQIQNNTAVVRAVGDVTAVKYRLVFGASGPVGRESNLAPESEPVRAFTTLVERRFEPTTARTLPTGLSVAGVVNSARPTFKWRLDEPQTVNGYATSSAIFGCSYTAFQIQVADQNGALVYDSGVVRAPAKNANGEFVWAAPLYAGDQTSLKKVFEAAGNWKWRVAMYNAKFKPVSREDRNGWSQYASFSTAVGTQQETDDRNYSSIDVAVKYAGPEAVLGTCEDLTKTNGKVRVQAFTTADFCGEPVAQGFVTNRASLADVSDITANGRLIGLPFGTYYIRAYIDSNGNFKKDEWESWGAAKDAVTVKADQLAPIVGLYIEDADTDQDCLPDALEYVTPEYEVGRSDITVDPLGRIVLKQTVYDGIVTGTAGISRFLSGVTLTFFENLEAAKALLKIDAAETTVDAIRQAVEKNIDPSSVKITSMVVDAANNRVILTVGAKVTDSIAGMLLSAVYKLPETTEVKVKVYRKENLATAAWGDPVKVETVSISSDMEKPIEVPLAGVDFNSGFYKVEIEQ